jgi:hypothetical protein
MVWRISLLLALAGALASVPVAGAVPVQVKVGDSVSVTSTKIGCFVKISADREAIVCELATTKGLIKNTYAVGISANGATVVDYVNAKGTKVSAVWAGRGKASARVHEATYYELRAGDSFGFKIPGGNIACEILDLKNVNATYTGRRVVCFRAGTSGKPVANSFGVVLSNKFVGSFRFNAKGNPGPDQYVHLQPK